MNYLLNESTQPSPACSALIGIEADPIRSREHILLSNILNQEWSAGRDLDIAGLIQKVQSPSITKIGVMDLDSFFPGGRSFRTRDGAEQPACIAELCKLDGRRAARHSKDSLHAGRKAASRDIFNRTPRRRRTHVLCVAAAESGARLDAHAIRNDEPARDSLHGRDLWLLPAGRKSAVEVAVADAVETGPSVWSWVSCWQRRIQSISITKDSQTRARGLSAACKPSATKRACWKDSKASQQARDRSLTSRRWSNYSPGLSNRIFLMNNVHDDAPEVFETRWAMSYLRGPLTRAQIKSLMDPLKGSCTASAAATSPSAGCDAAIVASAPAKNERPVLPPEITQYYIPVRSSGGANATLSYHPMLLGAAEVRYSNSKTVRHDSAVDIVGSDDGWTSQS